jgi:pimeloyl-ACP methyl ester carboxylesterase
MAMINLVDEQDPPGRLLMSEAELDVFAAAFTAGGFTGPINWYRNFTRNWKTLGTVPQKVTCPALMIHGTYDIVPESPKLTEFVPRAEVATLECGHWIQQEQPAQTNALMLRWLERNYPA